MSVCFLSQQYTYLFVQTWVRSQQPHNDLSILSLARLFSSFSSSLAILLSLPVFLFLSLAILSLSLSLMELWAQAEDFLHLLSDSLHLSEAERLSSHGSAHSPSSRRLFLPGSAPTNTSVSPSCLLLPDAAVFSSSFSL